MHKRFLALLFRLQFWQVLQYQEKILLLVLSQIKMLLQLLVELKQQCMGCQRHSIVVIQQLETKFMLHLGQWDWI